MSRDKEIEQWIFFYQKYCCYSLGSLDVLNREYHRNYRRMDANRRNNLQTIQPSETQKDETDYQ